MSTEPEVPGFNFQHGTGDLPLSRTRPTQGPRPTVAPVICELTRCNQFGKLEERQGWLAPVLVVLRPEHVSCCAQHPFDCTARTEYTLGDDGIVLVRRYGELEVWLDPEHEDYRVLRDRLVHLLVALDPEGTPPWHEAEAAAALKEVGEELGKVLGEHLSLTREESEEEMQLRVGRHLGLTPEEVL